MNTSHLQTENENAQCCVNYCSTTYNVTGQEVVNNYRCSQQRFSTANLWKLRNNKREFTIRTNLQ